VVAEDYAGRASRPIAIRYPSRLPGQTVEVSRQGAELHIFHRGERVAVHLLAAGEHQLLILPEHGPGAIARNARRRQGNPPLLKGAAQSGQPEVEVRDLALYEQLLGGEVAS
jgi:hypothetical protein